MWELVDRLWELVSVGYWIAQYKLDNSLRLNTLYVSIKVRCQQAEFILEMQVYW